MKAELNKSQNCCQIARIGCPVSQVGFFLLFFFLQSYNQQTLKNILVPSAVGESEHSRILTFKFLSFNDCVLLIYPVSQHPIYTFFWGFILLQYKEFSSIEGQCQCRSVSKINLVKDKKENSTKLIFSEKATQSEKIFFLALILLRNDKTKWKISLHFCGLLRKPRLYT